MSNTIRNNIFASFCFVAFLFAAAAGVVDAQSDSPIDDDDILACVTLGDEVWAAPVGLKQQLEDVTGVSATIESTRQLLNRLPQANPDNAVRFEGGKPDLVVTRNLRQLGYASLLSVSPQVPGAATAWTLTL